MINNDNIKIKKPIEPMRVNFDASDSKKFKDLYDLLGIKSKSDVIRFCLTFTHNILSKNDAPNTKRIKDLIAAILKTED